MSNSNIFIREQVRKILTEWGDVDGGMGTTIDLYDTFVAPVSDVFKVAFVAFKDITSATLDIADYLITFDSKKQDDIKERFRQRREKYKGQYKEAMKDVDAALDSDDARILFFMLGPEKALAKGAAKLTWSATEPFRDKIEDFAGGALGIGDTAIAATTDADKSPGLMADLKRAFFGEGLDEIDDIELILIEQEREKESQENAPSDSEIMGAVDDYLESVGFAEQQKEFWEAVLEEKQEEINAILEEQKGKVDLMTKLSVAETVADAEKHIAELAALGADLSSSFNEVKSAIEKETEKLVSNADAAKKAMSQLRKLPDAKDIPKDAPIDAYLPLIEKGMLGAAFGEAVDEAKKVGTGDLIGFVAEMSEEELADLAAMGSYGKQYSDMIYKFQNDLLTV